MNFGGTSGGQLPPGIGRNGSFGSSGGLFGAGAASQDGSLTPEQQQMQMVKNMQAAMESCPIKTIVAGGAGFALGGMFGLFMWAMAYDSPLSPGAQANGVASLPIRQQLKLGMKEMASRSYGSAKNFAVVGSIFAGTECCIESYRAKNDMFNGVVAGCITGGALAARAGPQAAAVGCAGFAAFSTAIEYYLRMD